MSNPTYSVAEPPFCRKDADVILLSKDSIKFYVHSQILKVSSSVFEDMFVVGDSTTTINNTSGRNPNPFMPLPGPLEEDEGIHIISLSESSSILDTVLRIIYPVPLPKVDNLSTVISVLEVGFKYQMECIVSLMKSELTKYIESNSLRVYSIACQYQLEDLAYEAALSRHISHLNLSPETLGGSKYARELSCMTAGQLYRLLWFLNRHSRNGENSLSPSSPSPSVNQPQPSPPIPSENMDQFTFTHKGQFGGIQHLGHRSPQASQNDLIERTDENKFDLHLERIAGSPTDIVLRSIDQRDFPAHEFILRMESTILAERMESSSSHSSLTSSLPSSSSSFSISSESTATSTAVTLKSYPTEVLQLSEDSETLSYILQLCYVQHYLLSSPNESFDIDIVSKTIQALRKYKMYRVITRAKTVFLDSTTTHNLEAYFISIACGWITEAKEFANALLDQDGLKSLYVTQMEKSSAKGYQRLLAYRGRYVSLIRLLIPQALDLEDDKIDIVKGLLRELESRLRERSSGYRVQEHLSAVEEKRKDVENKLNVFKKKRYINLDDVVLR